MLTVAEEVQQLALAQEHIAQTEQQIRKADGASRTAGSDARRHARGQDTAAVLRDALAALRWRERVVSEAIDASETLGPTT